MIIHFKVGNFKSINDEVVLNFNATSINEHIDSNTVQYGKHNVLKSLLLYGHNASGKSKILDALVFFKWFVKHSVSEKQTGIDVEPFEFLESSSNSPSMFEICFLHGNTKYRYGFEADTKMIHKEWLLESTALKEYPVFLRIGQKVKIEKKRFPNSDGLDVRTRKDALFLTVAAQWNVHKAQKIVDWVASIFSVHGLADSNYRKYTLQLLKNKRYTKIINKFIQNADLGINNVEIVDIPVRLEDVIDNVPDEFKNTFKEQFKERSETGVFTIHNKFNDKNEIVDTVPMPLDINGSEGTKKYFNLIGIFITALMENRLVVIDEFDARLHTLLSKAILHIFNSKKINSRAQLLVASHDTALLDNKLLRRDQIYFVEKNNIGASTVTSLVEYKPRKESPYDKNYLDGKYGSIPFIKDLEKLLLDEQKKIK